MPERLDVTLAPRDAFVRSAQKTRIDVDARYLYGAPGAGLAVTGDITLRATTGASPWRMAAPTGGMMLIAGWLWLSVAAFLGRRAPL